MTHDEIRDLTRRFLRSLAKDEGLRHRLSILAGTPDFDEKLVKLINETQEPREPLTLRDLPHVKQIINEAYQDMKPIVWLTIEPMIIHDGPNGD